MILFERDYYWLIEFAIAGVVLLVGAKGNRPIFRYTLIRAGIAIAVSVLCIYAIYAASKSNDRMGMEILAFFTRMAACAVGACFAVGMLLENRKSITMGRGARASCLAFAGLCFAASLYVFLHEEIATALQRRAVAAGSTSPFAESIESGLEPWGALAQLEPSPQKDQLIGMIEAYWLPPDAFWKTLLSLPPSPGRLAVISSFAHGMCIGKEAYERLAVLYDQSDTEALDVLFEKNGEKYYFGSSLTDIVKINRADILRDVLRRGGSRIAGGSKALDAAAGMKSPEMIDLLLGSGVSIDEGEDYSPLALAALRGGMEAARLLLERGADVNRNCLIMEAVRYPNMLTLLLEKGASPFCAREGQTPLHKAAELNAPAASMEILLRLGTDLDALDKNGWSPLLRAAWAGSYQALEHLANAGADVSLRDAYGRSALHLAATDYHVNYDIVTKLLEIKPDLATARDAQGSTVLHAAVANHPALSREDTAMYAVMARLVELHPDLVTARDAEGKTPLDYAGDDKARTILRSEEKK